MSLLKILAIFLILQISAVNCSTASLEGIIARIKWQNRIKKPKAPAQYYFSQQVGATCFLSCWINFAELQRIRAAHGGQILDSQGQFETSARAYNRLDWFLATTQPITNWYHIFQTQKRMIGSPFANFIKAAEDEEQTINSTDIPASYLKAQTLIDKEAIKSFWPHLLSKAEDHQGANFLYLPLVERGGTFYWGTEKHAIPEANITISRYQDLQTTAADTTKIIAFMPGKINKEPSSEIHISIPSAWAASYGFDRTIYCSGFKSLGHTIFSSAWQMVDYNSRNPDEKKSWYNFGLYKLALMAAKVDKNNDIVSDTASAIDWESQAILQFNRAVNANPNPWQNIDQKRDRFIEYRIGEIFKRDPVLKAQAIAVADVFFKTFGFYTAAKNLGFADKMYNLPGEDQMLAYCFCQSLHNLSAGSVSAEALREVLELEAGEARMFNAYLFFTARTNSLPAYCRKKYYEENTLADGSKTSFDSVWQNVKRRLALPDGTDMVSFSSHGAVLSFDSRALRAQHFEDRAMANDLGFATIDSSYANGLKPFYIVSTDDES
jgi:hypothetical protein